MIFDLFVTILAAIAWGFAQLFPDVDAPDVLTQVQNSVAVVTSHMAGLSVWVPLGTVPVAFAVVSAALATALIVRVTRLIVSLFSGGGGAV